MWCCVQLVGMADVVQWLRGTAATGGRLNAPSCVTPAETAPPEWQPAAVERRYRTALARCRSLMHALPPDAAAAAGRRRRSSRARHTPDVYIPGLDTPGSGLRCACALLSKQPQTPELSLHLL